MKHYVIYSQKESLADDYKEPMFWSNNDGWGSLATATVFDDTKSNLPLPNDSVWVELPIY